MKTIVTGWREYPTQVLPRAAFTQLLMWAGAASETLVVVHGDGRGLDQIMKNLVLERDSLFEDANVEQIPVPAKWAQFGRRAGLLRNEQMWLEHYADTDLCVGFPGPGGISTGTPHCMELARRHGCPVWEFPWDAGWVDPPVFRLNPGT